MTFNETDPTTWTDPGFHPDFGVDSAKYVDMLRACSTALVSKIPNLTAHLVVNTEDGILYCKIATDTGKLGELFCVESLNDDSIRFGFVSETRDLTKELEFYADTVIDICRIVSQIREGNDLESLLEEFGEHT